MIEREKVIINTDPGYDDAMALMLAIKSNRFDIQAITTTAGNSTVENTTRNARYILSLLKREDIPIFSGANKPLVRELDTAKVTGKSGLEGIDPTNKSNLTDNAIEKIIEVIAQSPGQITLISLGPLTNIAQVILQAPEICRETKELVIMGGAIRAPGNKNRVAEFNIYVDPEAADIVFKSDIKKVIVPLDACNEVWMNVQHFQQIKDSNLRDFLLLMIHQYVNNISKKAGEKKALMYDPLTVYYLLNPEACEIEEHDVLIETKGEVTRGMTVSDLRGNAIVTPNVNIVKKINSSAFIDDFIKILSTSQT